ncbi:MAG: CarD family transcriptional regulator [Actinomycetota bacterium]
MFNCGDRVVCPPHGAAVIEDLQDKWVLGEKRHYFIIKPFYGQLTIMLPVDRAVELGMRDVIDPSEIDGVLTVLGTKSSDLPANWNQRFKENWRKLGGGDILEVAEVVRDLSSIEKIKTLSAKEKDLLRQARRTLISELVFARGVEESEAIRAIEAAL